MLAEEHLSTDTKDVVKLGGRADRDNGCTGPQLADRFGKEHLRYAEQPVIAGFR